MLRETYEDYWQFIIVDRISCQPFVLLDAIGDILIELSGEPSQKSMYENVVKGVIPLEEQETYLDNIGAALEGERPETVFTNMDYEGNRSRCWDAENSLPELLASRRGITVPVEYSRFISRLCENLESEGTIRVTEEYIAPHGSAFAFPGSDGKLDLYIDYQALAATANPAALNSSFDLPPPDSLLRFAKAFKLRNAKAIFAKASVVTRYCAWPMDALVPRSGGLPTFTTPAGHVYEWLKTPFDYPFAANIWQYLLRHYFQDCAEFACFHLTAFVICAVDAQDAGEKVKQLQGTAGKHGLKLNIPPVSLWVDRCERAGLERIYKGVRPAGYER